jgi:hypothetical protein
VTPEQFIAKWKAAELRERSAAHSHFIDLCRMLDEPAPTDADPKGEWYAFERGATRTTGGDGWAEVWKHGHFGWEYKGKRKDLDAAFAQLQQYALALENPPLLVVCDLDRFRIRTNWTSSVSEVHEFALEDLRTAKAKMGSFRPRPGEAGKNPARADRASGGRVCQPRAAASRAGIQPKR